jgi:hypothetical protein
MKNSWDNFKHNIIHVNRFFPSDSNLFNNLNNILNTLIEHSSSSSFTEFEVFRARVGKYVEPKDLQKPKGEYVRYDGRCNPRGISYFYTSSNEITALHEVKANINDIVTMACFASTEELRICDFNSITLLEKEYFSGYNLLKDNEKELLNIILQELSKPVNYTETLEYIPIQYIVEYVKQFSAERSFDGFCFTSSYKNGLNYVFFDDKKFIHKGSLKYYKINNIKYSTSPPLE